MLCHFLSQTGRAQNAAEPWQPPPHSQCYSFTVLTGVLVDKLCTPAVLGTCKAAIPSIFCFTFISVMFSEQLLQMRIHPLYDHCAIVIMAEMMPYAQPPLPVVLLITKCTLPIALSTALHSPSQKECPTWSHCNLSTVHPHHADLNFKSDRSLCKLFSEPSSISE